MSEIDEREKLVVAINKHLRKVGLSEAEQTSEILDLRESVARKGDFLQMLWGEIGKLHERVDALERVRSPLFDKTQEADFDELREICSVCGGHHDPRNHDVEEV